MVEENSAYGQGAKIQRKIAMLTVQPRVIIDGRSVAITVQSFFPHQPLRVSLIRPTGELLQKQLVPNKISTSSLVLSLPDQVRGQFKVILEHEKNDIWMPICEKSILFIPDFLGKVVSYVKRIERVEKKSIQKTPVMVSVCHCVIAFAEDLLERAKFADPSHVWDLERRLVSLRTKVEKLEAGKDPLSNKRGYLLQGYRSMLNKEIQLYSLYVPKQYDSKQAWPMVVMLHGAWSNHHLALRRVMGKNNAPGEDDAKAKRMLPALPDVPYFVVAPNGHETMSYRGFAERDIWTVIADVRVRYNIDPNRVYLTGLSMGGAETLKLGLRNPDRFAALAAVCGYVGSNAAPEQDQQGPDFVQRMARVSAPINIAENALHIPIKLMHGEKDPIVPTRNSIAMHQRLQELGYRSELEIYPGVDHAAWVPAYENARIFNWFSQFKREIHPKKVVFKTGAPFGGASFWVRIEEPIRIREFAEIEAEIKDNDVYVQTTNVERFGLSIPTALVPLNRKGNIYVNGEWIYKGTISVERAQFPIEANRFQWIDGSWKKVDKQPPFRLRPDMNGLHCATEERHVYVYGTQGSFEENRDALSFAKAKSLSGEWADVCWDVLPEDALTKEMMGKNHLVLFGTVTGSSFIKEHIDDLPFRKKGSQLLFADRIIEPDQALSLVYPNPKDRRYYLQLNTASTVAGFQALKSFVAMRRSLTPDFLGDFVVFGPDGKPLWGGLFDKTWKIDEIGDF